MIIRKTYLHTQKDLENFANEIIVNAIKYNHCIINNYLNKRHISISHYYVSDDLSKSTKTEYSILYNDTFNVESIVHTNVNNLNNEYEHITIVHLVEE